MLTNVKKQENCPVFIRLSQKTRQNAVINTVFLNKQCRNGQIIVKMCCPYLNTLVSGSPIIQNGKLVGAVTYVLVANPTEDYGIFILLASFAALRRRFALCSVFGALAEQSALARWQASLPTRLRLIILLCGASVAAWCVALCSSFDEPPRSNLRSLADKQACRLGFA